MVEITPLFDHWLKLVATCEQSGTFTHDFFSIFTPGFKATSWTRWFCKPKPYVTPPRSVYVFVAFHL